MPPDSPLTIEDAQQRVFEHWSHLDALCRRRFPREENLAHEGLLYVLDRLEDNGWARVRCWEGLGRFLPYLLTLASRLLTDFSRSRFGYERKPKWLAEKSDVLWDRAYRLMIVKGYERREVVEMLTDSDPGRERWKIEKLVAEVDGRCLQKPKVERETVSLERVADPVAENCGSDSPLDLLDGDLLVALEHCLEGDANPTSEVPDGVSEVLRRLAPHLRLTEEDRMLIRMRYLEGLKISAIARLLRLSGDPYKRMERVMRGLRNAFKKAGLADVEDSMT